MNICGHPWLRHQFVEWDAADMGWVFLRRRHFNNDPKVPSPPKHTAQTEHRTTPNEWLKS